MQGCHSSRVVVVTQADGEIGRSVALEYARTGATLALIGRDAEALWLTARLVQVVGVHPRDAGLWMVHGCTHKVTEGETELELKRDGVNGARGPRQGAGARPNQHAGAQTPAGMAEPPVAVALGED